MIILPFTIRLFPVSIMKAPAFHLSIIENNLLYLDSLRYEKCSYDNKTIKTPRSHLDIETHNRRSDLHDPFHRWFNRAVNSPPEIRSRNPFWSSDFFFFFRFLGKAIIKAICCKQVVKRPFFVYDHPMIVAGNLNI
ncbi:hypothetical protein CEXT_238061 [Caerostris extrusa]|uniref:Uncharacterized protein n=1 Tax=Caerostris extrusa TaxID=172846 RepID=A0AAV4QMT2_CAEEX|nr:hypothetical protein CEXT_238061 [Caerostris extrusa]